jgi:hypothetical protein
MRDEDGQMYYVESIPNPQPTPQEISMLMRVNVDFLKLEISKHADKEIERVLKEINNAR